MSACIANTLQDVADNVGIPDTLVCDLATEQIYSDDERSPTFKDPYTKCRERTFQPKPQSRTKIGEFKKRWKTRMIEKKVPQRLWDYGLVYMAESLSITAREFPPQASGEVPTGEEYGEMLQNIDNTEIYDQYLNAEFIVNQGGKQVRARVAKQTQFDNGVLIGQQHTNPLLNTNEYECITEDGVLKRYSANIIAEIINSQCDKEGHMFLV